MVMANDSTNFMRSSAMSDVFILWNPSITDTIGNQNFVRYSKVSLTQGVSGIFPVGVVCVIGMLSAMWLLSELSFAVR